VAQAAVALQFANARRLGGRIAITGVAEIPFRALAAEPLLGPAFSGSQAEIAQIVDTAFADVSPLEDHFADGAYRIQLGKVMLKRALEAAMDRT